MSEFEARTRATFDDSASRLDGRVRSRLTQSRHAALAELALRRGGARSAWRSWFTLRVLAPAGAMAAAALLAVVLWTGPGSGVNVIGAAAGSPIEDMDLLADNDAMELGADGDYEFYEWAATQEDGAAQATQGT